MKRWPFLLLVPMASVAMCITATPVWAGVFAVRVRNLEGTLINAQNSPGTNVVSLAIRKEGRAGQVLGPLNVRNLRADGNPSVALLTTTDGEFRFEVRNDDPIFNAFADDKRVVLEFIRLNVTTTRVFELTGTSEIEQSLDVAVKLPSQMNEYPEKAPCMYPQPPMCEPAECTRPRRPLLFWRRR